MGVVRHEELRESRVDEDSAEDQAAYPDDRAAEIEWAGLHHGFMNFFDGVIKPIIG